ncbi:MAG: phosphatase PAP2 family protein [Candidatus Paceibacterota bacterium]|jgi:membrane-associated phospholipid phosphatase
MELREWIALVFVGIGYFFYPILNRKPSLPTFQLPIDQHIPLIPIFIYPYMLLHPMKILSIFLLMKTPLLFPYLVSTAMTGWICAFIWYIFPNGVVRPQPSPDAKKTLAYIFLTYIHRHDHDSNGLPSAHVAYAICIGYWLSQAFPHYVIPLTILSGCIALSTLPTKQHYVLDIPAGAIVGIGSILLTRMIL